MDIKDLKVGDKVFIREDLEDGFIYGNKVFTDEMDKGLLEVSFVSIGNTLIQVHGNPFCDYTPEMVDWEKTRRLKLNESWENIKKVIRGDGTFKEIIQSGESGNEVTKATTYDGKETMVKNNNEENDVEKAVMLLMLKQLGITYSEIKKEVKKVKIKWVPKQGEECYTILGSCVVMRTSYSKNREDTERLSIGNYFKTREEAERKAEEIKEVFKGE